MRPNHDDVPADMNRYGAQSCLRSSISSTSGSKFVSSPSSRLIASFPYPNLLVQQDPQKQKFYLHQQSYPHQGGVGIQDPQGDSKSATADLSDFGHTRTLVTRNKW